MQLKSLTIRHRSCKLTVKPEHFKIVVGADIWPQWSYIRPYIDTIKQIKLQKMANLSVVSYN